MRLPHQKISDALLRGDAAVTTAEKGAALEDAIQWTLCKLPGVKVLKRNHVDSAGSMEIDLFLFNSHRKSPIDFLPAYLLIECKNWNSRVDSATLREFLGKLRATHQKVGILVAASGITGDPHQVTAAHDVIRQAFDADDIKIIVITRSELCSLRTTEQLIVMLQEKYGAACLRSTALTE